MSDIMMFTGTSVPFTTEQLQEAFQQALVSQFGLECEVLIHDIAPGDWSDDITLQIIPT